MIPARRMKQPSVFDFIRITLLLGCLFPLPAAAQLSGPLAPPANDNFADAAEVAGAPLTLEADLAFATAEAFEAPQLAGHTAWWRWTTPADGIFEWDTAGSAGPVAVSVWGRDGLGQLVLRADSPELLTSSNTVVALRRGSFPARSNEVLWLRARATTESTAGGLIAWFPGDLPFGTNYPARITLQRSLATAPPNDEFVARVPLAGTNLTFGFRLDGATADDGEPRLPGDSLQRTAWWSWQAPGNGTARLRSVGTNGGPVVGVYRLGALFALEPAANSATEFGLCGHSEWRGRNALEWDVTAGEHYEIQADRYPWNQPEAEFQMALTFVSAPKHDNARHPLVLTGEEIRLTVNNEGATGQPGDPRWNSYPSYGSLWFAWTAPGRGVLQVGATEPKRYQEPSFEVLLPGGGGGGIGVVIIGGNFDCRPITDLHPLPPFVPVFGIHYINGSDSNGSLLLEPLAWGTNSAVAAVGAAEYRLEFNSLFETPGESPMNLLFTGPPVNDRFTNRIRLPSAAVKVGGRTFAARPTFTPPVGGPQAWWEWTAPTSGDWVLRPIVYAADQQLRLFRGGEPTPTTPGRGTEWSPLVFTAQAGEVFQIAAIANTGLGNNVGFELVPAVPPSLQLQRSLDWWAGVQFDTVSWPFGFDLPRVLETSTDLEHWTPTSSQSGWQFSTPVNQNEPRRFYRVRLLTE